MAPQATQRKRETTTTEDQVEYLMIKLAESCREGRSGARNSMPSMTCGSWTFFETEFCSVVKEEKL